MASIKDVAKAANVSPTTVSAVVNGHNVVKPETRERVLNAIKKLNYKPNISARELVTKKKQNIGLVTMQYCKGSTPANVYHGGMEVFYTEYIQEIAEIIKTSGYGLLIENFVYKEGSRDIPQIIEEKRVDGVLVAGSIYKRELIARIKEKIDDIVTIGAFSDITDCVINNYAESMSMAMQYLIKNGHKKIAYVSGDPVSYAYPYKMIGYKSELDEAGIEFDSDLVFDGKFIYSHGYESAKRIYELPKKKFPTAIIFGSDVLAAGACEYFYEKGVHIPNDISLMGYENLIISAYMSSPLSTVDFNKGLMAQKACELLLDRLKNPKKDNVGIIVPCNIIERKSVKNIVDLE